MVMVVLIVFVVLSLVFAVVNARDPKLPTFGNSTEYDAETVSTENPSSAVTIAPSRSTSAVTPPRRTTLASRPADYEALSSLPAIYYVLAIFCGVVLIGFTIANADELSSTQIGAWIGYTVGAVLSMLAVGRVIELLQQIRDAVRS